MASQLEANLESMLARFRSRLRAIIQQRCPPQLGLDADDVEQEVRIRLWKALASERVIEHPASYLHQVALSVIVDLLRRRKARPDLDPTQDIDDVDALAALDRQQPSPARMADNAAAGQALLRAVSALPERRRRPVQLHLQGFTTAEVGEWLGMTEASARNLVYRGMDELRERLQAQGWKSDDGWNHENG